MYGYEAVVEITPEQLLQKVSQQQIFSFVLKENFSWTARYKSPFREHSKGIGTCRFEQREDGTILFVDFGDVLGRTHRSCFRMVMDAFDCNLTTSIKILCEHFKLPLNPQEYAKATVIEYDSSAEANKVRAAIDYEPKPYNKFDVQWWSQFLIKTSELLEDGVHNVFRYTVKGADGKSKTFNPYKYCYAIDFIDTVKIYQPFQTEYKWITNCDENDIGNIDNLPPTGHELIIKKSYKDHRVIRNVLNHPSVIWFQNEGCIPSHEILYNLVERFDILTFFYDNDAAGIAAALRLAEEVNKIRPGKARATHLPIDCRHKDPSGFVSKEGRYDLLEVLKTTGIVM